MLESTVTMRASLARRANSWAKRGPLVEARLGTATITQAWLGSASGTAWTFETTLSAPAGLVTGMVNGGPDGAAITAQEGQAGQEGQEGQEGGTLTAFVSANGVSWQQTKPVGSAATESVSGVATTEGGWPVE